MPKQSINGQPPRERRLAKSLKAFTLGHSSDNGPPSALTNLASLTCHLHLVQKTLGEYIARQGNQSPSNEKKIVQMLEETKKAATYVAEALGATIVEPRRNVGQSLGDDNVLSRCLKVQSGLQQIQNMVAPEVSDCRVNPEKFLSMVVGCRQVISDAMQGLREPQRSLWRDYGMTHLGVFLDVVDDVIDAGTFFAVFPYISK